MADVIAPKKCERFCDSTTASFAIVHLDRRGVGAGAAAYVMWGLLTVYWHELRRLPAIALIGQRVIWASVLLAIVIGVTRRWEAIARIGDDKRLLMRVCGAALLLSANWFCYVWAVTHDNVVETALGYFMAPLVTVGIGVVVFHERVRRTQTVALTIAAGAVVILTFEAGNVPFFALTLAITWGFYGLMKRTISLQPIESLAAETFVLLPIALAIIAISESGDHSIRNAASGWQLAMVAGTGAITVIPLLLFAVAAPRVPFTVLGPLQYAVPTINFVLAVAIYHERMPALRVCGFALVWCALVVFTVDSIHNARRFSVGVTSMQTTDEDVQDAAATSPR